MIHSQDLVPFHCTAKNINKSGPNYCHNFKEFSQDRIRTINQILWMALAFTNNDKI